MNKEYVALFFAVAAILGAYFQYSLGKELAIQGKGMDAFYVVKILSNLTIAIIGIVFFFKYLFKW